MEEIANLAQLILIVLFSACLAMNCALLITIQMELVEWWNYSYKCFSHFNLTQLSFLVEFSVQFWNEYNGDTAGLVWTMRYTFDIVYDLWTLSTKFRCVRKHQWCNFTVWLVSFPKWIESNATNDFIDDSIASWIWMLWKYCMQSGHFQKGLLRPKLEFQYDFSHIFINWFHFIDHQNQPFVFYGCSWVYSLKTENTIHFGIVRMPAE